MTGVPVEGLVSGRVRHLNKDDKTDLMLLATTCLGSIAHRHGERESREEEEEEDGDRSRWRWNSYCCNINYKYKLWRSVIENATEINKHDCDIVRAPGRNCTLRKPVYVSARTCIVLSRERK